MIAAIQRLCLKRLSNLKHRWLAEALKQKQQAMHKLDNMMHVPFAIMTTKCATMPHKMTRILLFMLGKLIVSFIQTNFKSISSELNLIVPRYF